MLRPLILSALALAALTSNKTHAIDGSQFLDPVDHRFDMSDYLANNAFGFLPIPIVITDPAVEGGLGVIGLFFNESEEAATQRQDLMNSQSGDVSKYLLPPNVTALAAAYTGNGSWLVGAGHIAFSKGDNIRYMGFGGLADITADYYGTGGLELPNPISINNSGYLIFNKVVFRVGDSKLFTGIKQQYIADEMDISTGGTLADYLPPELQQPLGDQLQPYLSQSVNTSGLGVVAQYDSRDNFFSPHSGLSYELEYTIYDEAIGSDVDYSYFHFKGLNYFSLNHHWRINFRADWQSAITDRFLPPYATPQVSLRGIPNGRYMGNRVGTVETEIDYQYNQRWSLSVFTGLARVADHTDQIRDAASQITKGIGFRYLIARRYGLDMGIDIARGPEDTIFYITAGTAWR